MELIKTSPEEGKSKAHLMILDVNHRFICQYNRAIDNSQLCTQRTLNNYQLINLSVLQAQNRSGLEAFLMLRRAIIYNLVIFVYWVL